MNSIIALNVLEKVGFLCESADEYVSALKEIEVMSEHSKLDMRQRACGYVSSKFSMTIFQSQFLKVVEMSLL
jgi:hypothetical protein